MALTVAIALTLVRVWLVAAQQVDALGVNVHDDALYTRLANEILHGRWLGDYDRLTLAKGPFYPMWIAASFKMGLPLLLSQQLLYVAACALLAGLALRPTVRPSGRLVLYLVLLFNPVAYSAGPAGADTRVIREGIYPALSLLVAASLCGLVSRWKRTPLPWGWALALGASAVAFWTTREEGPWIAPAALLLVALAAYRDRATLKWWRVGALLGASGALALACWGTLATVNWRHYRRFTVVEFRDRPFPAAYGALCRIEHAPAPAWIHVPREARERAYAVSPAFARLRPALEGNIGKGWIELACRVWNICDDIPAGFLMWAIRDAVQGQGIHDAAAAAAYYEQVAAEINAACADGRLKCTAPRVSMMPPWRAAFVVPALRETWRALWYVARFKDVTPFSSVRSGSPEALAMFARLTRGRLFGDPPAAGVRDRSWAVSKRLAVLQALARLYGVLAPALLVLSACTSAFLLALALRRRECPSPLWAIAGMAGLALVARVLVVGLVEATSFTAVHNVYLSAAHPFMLVFIWASAGAALARSGGTPAPRCAS